MKLFLVIFCWVLAFYSIYFPFSYFNKTADIKEVKISHILVNTEEEANNIKEELKNNSFEKLAEKYSICPSAKQKGNLGYNSKDNLISEIADTTYKMNKNEISNPVKTEQGWHILKVYDIKYFSDKENFKRKYF